MSVNTIERFFLKPVTVRIRRTADGKTVEYGDSLYTTPDYDGLFVWTDGNYQCDCNRHLFFQRSLGLEDDDGPCSDGKYQVEIKDGDKVLYSDMETP